MGKSIFQKIYDLVASTYQMPFFVPEVISRGPSADLQYEYKLTFAQRVFITLEDFNSCLLAVMISTIIQLSVIVGVTASVLATLPSSHYTPETCHDPVCSNDPVLCKGITICAPVVKPEYDVVQFVIFYVLVVDYVIRMSIVMFMPPRLANILPKDFDLQQIALFAKGKQTHSDPEFSMVFKFYKYAVRIVNIVDFLSCFPTFIQLIASVGSNSTVVRILRISRVFRILKLSRSNDTTVIVMFSALSAALQSLIVLTLCGFMLIVLFGSIEYALESGTFIVTEEYPKGAYMVPQYDGSGYVMSPFKDVLYSFYWATITLTTVGYGDMFPRTPSGRLVAALLALVGNLMLSLPVTVVGHFFQRDFQDFVEARKRQEQAALLKFVEETERKEREKMEREKLEKLLRASHRKLTLLEDQDDSGSGSDSEGSDTMDDVSAASRDSALQEIHEIRDQLKSKIIAQDLSALIERGHVESMFESVMTSGSPNELRALAEAIDISQVNLQIPTEGRLVRAATLETIRSHDHRDGGDQLNGPRKVTRSRSRRLLDAQDSVRLGGDDGLNVEDSNNQEYASLPSSAPTPMDKGERRRIHFESIASHGDEDTIAPLSISSHAKSRIESHPSFRSAERHLEHRSKSHAHHSKSHLRASMSPTLVKAAAALDADINAFEDGTANLENVLHSIISACETFEKELDVQRKFAQQLETCARMALMLHKTDIRKQPSPSPSPADASVGPDAVHMDENNTSATADKLVLSTDHLPRSQSTRGSSPSLFAFSPGAVLHRPVSEPLTSALTIQVPKAQQMVQKSAESVPPLELQQLTTNQDSPPKSAGIANRDLGSTGSSVATSNRSIPRLPPSSDNINLPPQTGTAKLRIESVTSGDQLRSHDGAVAGGGRALSTESVRPRLNRATRVDSRNQAPPLTDETDLYWNSPFIGATELHEL